MKSALFIGFSLFVCSILLLHIPSRIYAVDSDKEILKQRIVVGRDRLISISERISSLSAQLSLTKKMPKQVLLDVSKIKTLKESLQELSKDFTEASVESTSSSFMIKAQNIYSAMNQLLIVQKQVIGELKRQ